MGVQTQIDRIRDEVASQTSLISQIQTALEGKAAGSGGGAKIATGTLTDNTTGLEEILAAVNELPDYSSGGDMLSFDLVYPVGSIYFSANETSPAALFGGSWERILDRFLLAAGTVYAPGSTGGEASVELTTDQIPAHSHVTNEIGIRTSYATNATDGYATMRSKNQSTNTYVSIDTGGMSEVGGGQAHNNMPPYQAVYVWKRVS